MQFVTLITCINLLITRDLLFTFANVLAGVSVELILKKKKEIILFPSYR